MHTCSGQMHRFPSCDSHDSWLQVYSLRISWLLPVERSGNSEGPWAPVDASYFSPPGEKTMHVPLTGPGRHKKGSKAQELVAPHQTDLGKKL